MTDLNFLETLVFLGVGMVMGAVFLALLWIGTHALASRKNWQLAALLAVVRLAMVAMALWLALQYGPLQMLALFIGFIVARQICLASARRA